MSFKAKWIYIIISVSKRVFMLAFAHNSVSYFPVDNNIYQQNSFFFLFIWYSALILGYTSINIRVFAFFSFFFFEGVQHHVAEAAAARTETVETEACGNNSYDQTQTRI